MRHAKFQNQRTSGSEKDFYHICAWLPSRSGDFDFITPSPGAGARWPSGRTSDSGTRGRGFDTYLRRVVSLSI